MVPNLVAIPIMLAGTEAQKAAYLPQFCDEAMPKMTAALTEPIIQFNPYKLKTTASLAGENYVLNGTKTAVPLAADAEMILIYANEDGKTQGFLVPADTGGETIGERNKLMGLNALPLYPVTLENVRIPAENRLGGEAGADFSLILNHSRVALAAMAVGMARATFLNKMATRSQDVTATLSMGMTLDHAVSMSIPVLGGAAWMAFGFEYVFVGAAGIALSSSLVAAFVHIPDDPAQEE